MRNNLESDITENNNIETHEQNKNDEIWSEYNEELQSTKEKEKRKNKNKILRLKGKLFNSDNNEWKNNTNESEETIWEFIELKENDENKEINEINKSLKKFKRSKFRLLIKSKLWLNKENTNKKLKTTETIIKALEDAINLKKKQIEMMKTWNFKEYRNWIFDFQINKWTNQTINDIVQTDSFAEIHVYNKQKDWEKLDNYEYKNFFNVIKQFAKKFPDIQYATIKSWLFNKDFINYYKNELKKEWKDTETSGIITSFDNLIPYEVNGSYKTELNENQIKFVWKNPSEISKYIERYKEEKGIKTLPKWSIVFDLNKIRQS